VHCYLYTTIIDLLLAVKSKSLELTEGYCWLMLPKHQPNHSWNQCTSRSLFITCDVSQESNKDPWFLDNGYSKNFTKNKNLFASLDNYVITNFKLGDDNVVTFFGKGTISVLTKNDGKKNISNVYLF